MLKMNHNSAASHSCMENDLVTNQSDFIGSNFTNARKLFIQLGWDSTKDRYNNIILSNQNKNLSQNGKLLRILCYANPETNAADPFIFKPLLCSRKALAQTAPKHNVLLMPVCAQLSQRTRQTEEEQHFQPKRNAK